MGASLHQQSNASLSQQQERTKDMHESDKKGMRLQLAAMPVEHIVNQIAIEQEHCQLLQEELYSRAEFYTISQGQWRVFQSEVQVLIKFLQRVQEGEVVGKDLLDKRDAAICLLERYVDGSLPETPSMIPPQQEKGKREEQGERHAPTSSSVLEAFYRKELSDWPVETLLGKLAQSQTECYLVAEALYTHTELQTSSVQHWHAFQRTARPFLAFLRGLQGGSIVDDDLLQHRDVFLSTLEHYLDEPPPK